MNNSKEHWITAYMAAAGMDEEQLARETGVSVGLILMLEAGAITHPKLANRIAETCGATPEQRDMLVAKQHRGTWKPKRRRTAPRRQREEAPAPAKAPPPRPGMGVVAVDRQGRVLARYANARQAAQMEGMSHGGIFWRCHRRTDGEWKGRAAATYRFADEWDRMTEAERLADMQGRYKPKRKTEGGTVPPTKTKA